MISNSEFVHFHQHSDQSFFDGLAPIDDLVMTARKMGFKALALTDHGTVSGWLQFYQACKKTKDKKGNKIDFPPIKPLIGIETYICKDHTKTGLEAQPEGRKGNRHLVLIAKNQEGYKNICRLTQEAWVNGQGFGSPRINLQKLAEHSKGVMCHSACLSSIINSNLLYGKYDQAKRAATLFKDIYGDDFALEVMYHGYESQALILPDIYKLGRELNIRLLATNDGHTIRKGQLSSQQLLMAMSSHRCIKDPKAYSHPYDELYLKSAAEMELIFGHTPNVLRNTVEAAERVEDFLQLDGTKMRLPKFPLPEEFKTPTEYMEHLAWQGMKTIKTDGISWDKSQPHIDQLKKELRLIQVALTMNGMDFPTYFLIKWDALNFCKERKIITAPGRGSGYASVLLRALGICRGNVDPLKTGLVFERFIGFDRKPFFIEDDFGWKKKTEPQEIEIDSEDRPLEEDLGGVDRVH